MIGEFWSFYQGAPDAALIFGDPLTEQFPAPDGSGILYQYFERARLELDPTLPAGQQVQSSPLGKLLYLPGLDGVNIGTPGACRVFPNGLGVCYDFLSFYDLHGGSSRFGSPISAFEFQTDGRIIQHFEKARFEYYPELGAGNTVQLADLGRLYFSAHEDLSRLNAAPPYNNLPQLQNTVTSLRLSAFVHKAVTRPDDTQAVYVIVQDQALRPVEGASGSLTLHFPSGQDIVFPLTTDAGGIALLPDLVFSAQPSGSLVTIDIHMTYLGVSADAAASFRIWR